MTEAEFQPLQGLDQPPSLERCRESWLELFFATLFYPAQTFAAIADMPEPDIRLLFYALFSVLLVSVMAPISRMIDTAGNPANLGSAIPFSLLIGILLWAFMALVIAMLSYAYTGKTRFRTFLTLSGQATLPWVFMAPISLLKIGIGLPGLIVCAILGLAVWLWSIFLFVVAVMNTYNMNFERALIVLLTPFTMMLVLIGWLLGFINHFIQFFP